MVVVAIGLPSFRAAHLNLPSNLHFTVWDKLVRTHEHACVVEFLKFGFLANYEGPAPTPTTDNHPSILNHASNVTSYFTLEVKEGAMLSPFDQPLFTPWCQVNALLTSHHGPLPAPPPPCHQC